ncbi:MAG: hypothetical protein L6R38_001217 [Xanthoria sp. 2 TBL-2021]|nr:MAG: hypothetical protein L6R38_001217 [Xanthoria sp. 2 TBL-2021]
MTVTTEELEAEGWPIEEQTAHWENGNRGLQQHKFASYLRFHLTQHTLQQWWPLKDVHEFCRKLCAISATVDIAFGRELSLWLWSKWYRPGIPCRFSNFFARFVASHHPDSPKKVPDLLDAHRRICAQVVLRQITLTAEDYKPVPQRIDERVDSLHENHENDKLEDTFHALFIVIDTNFPCNAFGDRDRNDQEFPRAYISPTSANRRVPRLENGSS